MRSARRPAIGLSMDRASWLWSALRLLWASQPPTLHWTNRTPRSEIPPGQEALQAEVGRLGVVEAVEVAGRLRLLREVVHLRGLGLHAEGQLERRDPGVELAVGPAERGASALRLGDQVEFQPLEVAAGRGVADERDPGVLRLHPRVAERRPLVGGREEPRAEVVRAALGEVLADRDVAGDVLVLGPEPVRDPRPQARPDERVAPGVPLQHGPAVPRVRAVHRVDHAEVVDAAGDLGEERADPASRSARAGGTRTASRRGCPSGWGTRGPAAASPARAACRLSRASRGLGSNVSRCDGPPNMNRRMTRFTFAGKCGGFAASGSAAPAALASSASSAARARPPKPAPAAPGIAAGTGASRSSQDHPSVDRPGISLDVEELVGRHQGAAEPLPGQGPAILRLLGGQRRRGLISPEERLPALQLVRRPPAGRRAAGRARRRRSSIRDPRPVEERPRQVLGGGLHRAGRSSGRGTARRRSWRRGRRWARPGRGSRTPGTGRRGRRGGPAGRRSAAATRRAPGRLASPVAVRFWNGDGRQRRPARSRGRAGRSTARIASRSVLGVQPRPRHPPEEPILGIDPGGPLVPGRAHLIGLREQDPPVEGLDRPAVGDEPGRQPVEQLGVRGASPSLPKLSTDRDEPPAEMPPPDAVDDHPRRERVARARPASGPAPAGRSATAGMGAGRRRPGSSGSRRGRRARGSGDCRAGRPRGRRRSPRRPPSPWGSPAYSALASSRSSARAARSSVGIAFGVAVDQGVVVAVDDRARGLPGASAARGIAERRSRSTWSRPGSVSIVRVLLKMPARA